MISTIIFNSGNFGTTGEIEENIHVRDSWEGRQAAAELHMMFA